MIFRPSSVAEFLKAHPKNVNKETVPQFLINFLVRSPNTAIYIEHLCSFTEDLAQEIQTDKPNLTTLLFQMGYLTIDTGFRKGNVCKLVFPSETIKKAVLRGMVDRLTQVDIDQAVVIGERSKEVLEKGDIDAFVERINTLLQRVDSDLLSEFGAYSLYAVCLATLAIQDVAIAPESMESECVNLTVQFPEKVCLLELKLDQDLDVRSSHNASQKSKTPCFHVRLSFSSKSRTITAWRIAE